MTQCKQIAVKIDAPAVLDGLADWWASGARQKVVIQHPPSAGDSISRTQAETIARDLHNILILLQYQYGAIPAPPPPPPPMAPDQPRRSGGWSVFSNRRQMPPPQQPEPAPAWNVFPNRRQMPQPPEPVPARNMFPNRRQMPPPPQPEPVPARNTFPPERPQPPPLPDGPPQRPIPPRPVPENQQPTGWYQGADGNFYRTPRQAEAAPAPVRTAPRPALIEPEQDVLRNR